MSVPLFTGQYENRIDKKGRVSVPAPFRSILGAPTGNVVLFYPPDRTRSLEGGSLDRLEQIQQQMDQLSEYTAEYKKLELVFHDATELPFDAEGRIVLPRKLIDHTEIDEIVMFVGSGRKFRVWSPANYQIEREKILAAADTGAGLPPLSTPGGAA